MIDNNNKNINNLYKEIFNNKFISKTIFYNVVHNRICKNYYDICSIDWMIKHQYYNLLLYKLDRNEYLLLSDKRVLFDIRDYHVFKRMFELYKDYFPPSHLANISQYPSLLYSSSSLEIIQYLVENGYGIDLVSTMIELGWSYKNYSLIKYLVTHFGHLQTQTHQKEVKQSDQFIITCLDKSIQFQQIDMVQFFLQEKYIVENMDESSKSLLLTRAFSLGSVECFKLIYQHYPCDPCLEWFTSNTGKDLFEMIKYVVSTFKEKIKVGWLHAFCKSVSLHHNYEALFYLVDEKIVGQEVLYFPNLAINAFVIQRLDFYDRCKTENTHLSCLSVSNVRGALDSIEKTKELIKEKGLKVTPHCMNMATNETRKHMPELMELLWSHLGQSYKEATLASLLNSACFRNSFKLLDFCFKHSTNFTIKRYNWPTFIYSDQSLPFVQLYLNSFKIEIDDNDQQNLQALGQSIKYGAVQLFYFLFSKLKPSTVENSLSMDPLYEMAVSFSRFEILEFLIGKKIPHNNVVIGYSKSIEMIKLLIDNGHTFNYQSLANLVSSDIQVLNYFFYQTKSPFQVGPIDEAIIKSIKLLKIQHFKLLIDNANELFKARGAVRLIMEHLGGSGHLEMLKYFDGKLEPREDFYQECFDKAIEKGHLEMVKYLIDTYDPQCSRFINRRNLKFSQENSFILEFLKPYFCKKDSKLLENITLDHFYHFKSSNLTLEQTKFGKYFIHYISEISPFVCKKGSKIYRYFRFK
ncbi:hypothetical protein CYY_007132 [Polysphondylium violaceum]|uniref:Ankyrin repeat-containing protein n=1 Tax=Polysphondylium violaceum TaxID=133409 RepID=A0A8J4PP34_9MYCE|nr:hypothetical protein CYY_007132 [Polysphondylium violaceum]